MDENNNKFPQTARGAINLFHQHLVKLLRNLFFSPSLIKIRKHRILNM